MANITRRGETGIPDLRREIDRLFEDFFSMRSGGGGEVGGLATFVPRLEVREEDSDWRLRVELPGMRPEEVELSIDNNVLTVRGERRREQSQNQRGYVYSESSYGTFTRSIQLPQGTDPQKVQADFHDGVLDIRVPKAEATRARRIQIGGGGAQATPQHGAGATMGPGNGEQAGRTAGPPNPPSGANRSR